MKNLKIILMSLALWATAFAVEANADVFPSRPDVFTISGPITFQHEQDFRLNKDTIKFLVLNSHGGEMHTAYNIMIMVSHLDITAIVPKNATCQSACTVIYQAAKRRIAAESATFVYHPTRFDSRFMVGWINQCPRPSAGCKLVFDQMTKDLLKETWKMFRALEQFGMDSDEVIRQLSMLPRSEDPNWIQQGNLLRVGDLEYTATEAMKYGIVTEVIPTSE